MKIQQINNINNTHFSSINKDETQQITQKHIAFVSTTPKSLLKEMDQLGLLNKPFVKQIQTEIELQTRKSCHKSIKNIAKIIKQPIYTIEEQDNGYFFEYENPKAWAETLKAYKDGDTKYYTPVLAQEQLFLKELRNLAVNGNIDEKVILEKVLLNIKNAEQIHYTAIINANNNEELSQCYYPKENTYGIVVPLQMKSFYEQTISEPIIDTIEQMNNRLCKAKESHKL